MILPLVRPISWLWGLIAPAVALGASPALAALPESLASPVVTATAGVATMLGLAGGGYLLLLRKRLSCLQIQLGVESDSRRQPAEEMSFSAGRDRYFRLAAEAGYGLEGWIDLTGRLYWVNQAIERYTGRSVEEVLAGDFFELTVYERDRSYSRDLLRQALETGVAAEFELRLVNERGNVQWMASHWQPIRSDDGTLLGLRVTMTDIQARKEAEFKLLESVAALRRAQALSEHYLRRSNEERSRLSALLDAIRLGILFMDSDRRVVYCNRALSEIWGLPDSERFVGMRDVVLQKQAFGMVLDCAAYQRHIADVLMTRDPSDPFEIEFKDGRVVTDFSRVVPGPDGARPIGRIWIFEDVTEQRRVARQLLHLAERDPLTNLFNRRRFHEELERMLADGRRNREAVGLLAIDLDGFKPVNDGFGHQAGDEVLVELARAVGAVVRRNEMFFRTGGDEFAILVPVADAPGLAELARRVCACISGLTFSFGGEPATVAASIGIALSTRHGEVGESLIGAADRAMYCAKSRGGNGWEFAQDATAAPVD